MPMLGLDMAKHHAHTVCRSSLVILLSALSEEIFPPDGLTPRPVDKLICSPDPDRGCNR